jgi:hypothetical protein
MGKNQQILGLIERKFNRIEILVVYQRALILASNSLQNVSDMYKNKRDSDSV